MVIYFQKIVEKYIKIQKKSCSFHRRASRQLPWPHGFISFFSLLFAELSCGIYFSASVVSSRAWF
jgi:hypothetical protein